LGEAVAGGFEGGGVLVLVGCGVAGGFPGARGPVWVWERDIGGVIGRVFHGGSKKGRSGEESGVLTRELMIEWGYESQK